MACNNLLRIKSPWLCDTSGQDNIIHINVIDNDQVEEINTIQENEDISELTPLVLSRPESEADECLLSFDNRSRQSVVIKRFEILSDTKTVEIFHKTDGYLFCIRGKSVIREGEENLFKHSSKFDFPNCEFYFKFPVKEEVKCIKLYKINLNITLEGHAEEFIGNKMIDLEKVKGYLGDIPENAKGLFQNMEAYQKNQQSMQSSLLGGSGMGGFGMMGMMSALMGSLKPPTNVSNHIPQTKVDNVNNIGNGPIDSEVKEEKSPCDDQSNDNKVEKDQDSSVKIPQNDILTSLLNRSPGGNVDSGMLSVLKNICSSVSNQRTPVKEDSTLGDYAENAHKNEKEVDVPETSVKMKLEEQFQKTEDRLKLYVDQQLLAMEDRLNTKLDRILACLSNITDDKPP